MSCELPRGMRPPNPLNLLGAPDAPGDLSVGSVSGGSVVQITPNLAGLARSDAWWNTDGNRLLYRESLAGVGLVGATYVVSQADQPVGIARTPPRRAADRRGARRRRRPIPTRRWRLPTKHCGLHRRWCRRPRSPAASSPRRARRGSLAPRVAHLEARAPSQTSRSSMPSPSPASRRASG